jgi:hypothetical protein
VRLDNERRAIWEKIDAGVPENIVVKGDDEHNAVEKNVLALGAKLAKRVNALKGYIAKNEKALAGHIKKGATKKAENSKIHLKKHKAELAELQAILGENET